MSLYNDSKENKFWPDLRLEFQNYENRFFRNGLEIRYNKEITKKYLRETEIILFQSIINGKVCNISAYKKNQVFLEITYDYNTWSSNLKDLFIHFGKVPQQIKNRFPLLDLVCSDEDKNFFLSFKKKNDNPIRVYKEQKIWLNPITCISNRDSIPVKQQIYVANALKFISEVEKEYDDFKNSVFGKEWCKSIDEKKLELIKKLKSVRKKKRSDTFLFVRLGIILFKLLSFNFSGDELSGSFSADIPDAGNTDIPDIDIADIEAPDIDINNFDLSILNSNVISQISFDKGDFISNLENNPPLVDYLTSPDISSKNICDVGSCPDYPTDVKTPVDVSLWDKEIDDARSDFEQATRDAADAGDDIDKLEDAIARQKKSQSDIEFWEKDKLRETLNQTIDHARTDKIINDCNEAANKFHESLHHSKK